MSRGVPFEDPLLNPSTPEPVLQAQKEPGQTQPRQSLQVDDGPIPFQTTSGVESPPVFSPPPFPTQPKVVAPIPQLAVPLKTEAETEARKASAIFVDPLTAALESQEPDTPRALPGAGASPIGKRSSTRVPSPNVNIPATNNTIPTEFPTHLASPPLPQRPIANASNTFQPLSSALKPSPASGTPLSVSTSGSGMSIDNSVSYPSLESTDASLSQLPSAFGLSPPIQSPSQSGISTPASQQWIRGHGAKDSSDMVQQDLKSPVLEVTQRHPFQETPRSSQSSVSGFQVNPLRINSIEQGRDHVAGVLSPTFAVSQGRQEGFPTLNAHNMFHDVTMSDAMNELMVRQIPADQRVLRDWNAPTEAEQRQAPRDQVLRELTVNNSWRAMARYTRSQILATRADQIPELINLWYARLLSLVKLGQYDMAQAELDQLGDLGGSQYRYESYSPDLFTNSDIWTREKHGGGNSRKGCMVPFELFVLKARLQGYLGDIYESIDQLYDLIVRCKKFEAICQVGGDSIGAQQWRDITGQLHLMVLNCLVELNDLPAATRHGRELVKRYPQDINLHSGLGRLYLQLGDVTRAEEVFKNVEELVTNHNYSETERAHFQLQLATNRALLAVTQGQWQVAKSAFEEVLSREPENLTATNNLVVCELYAGQLNDAIPRLERLMFAYPTSAGASESLVFNMATLYELRTEGYLRKKQQMLLEVSKCAGDQFDVSKFKI